MKRSRSSSKSHSSDTPKDEPPKKVKKRIVTSSTKEAKSSTKEAKSTSTSSPRSSPTVSKSTTATSTPPTKVPPPAPVSKVVPTPKPVHLNRSISTAASLGSLPLYGEQLPAGGYVAIPTAAKDTCAELKDVLEKVQELKKSSSGEKEIESQKKRGMVIFTLLKKFNRLSHLYCKDAREQTHEQKTEVDDLHLQLQNLMYEAMHLRKEITNCLEFKSQHEEIDLMSEEELYETAPESISKPDITKDNDHQRMLSRLEWELEQRKLLAKQQSKLEEEVNSQDKTVSKKQEMLDSLLPTLENIRQATLPLQEQLGMPLDKRREERELSLYLPSPLYIFFMQARAYAQFQDSAISVSILGDIEEAKSFKTHTHHDQSDEDSGESDNEGESSSRRKKRRKRNKGSHREKKDISKAFPLVISLTLTLNEMGSMQLTFSYLPHFSAVCAFISSITLSDISDTQLSLLIEKSSFLHCLFDGDTGRTSPNSLVSFHIRKHGGDIFSSAVRQYGFPFKWVQRLCGIEENVETLDSVSSERQVEVCVENIGNVMKALRQRFIAQVYLTRQLVKLASDDRQLDLGPGADDLFPDAVNSQLARWKPLSLSEMQTTQFASLAIFNQQERTNRFFLATFQLKQARLHCLVCVSTNYPSVPPCVAIMIDVAGQREPQGINIKNLEADVNIHFPQAIKNDKNGEFLLSRQLRRVQDCFDLYMEYKESPKGRKSRLLHRMRGRGRLLTLTET